MRNGFVSVKHWKHRKMH